MDQPVTDLPGPERADRQEWLMDADDPALTDGRMAAVADPARPDRLAWNALRTLALWNTEAWAPRLLEIACGEGSRLAVVEWDGGAVVPWATDLPGDDMCDVALVGPAAYVVLACTFDAGVSLEQLRAAAMAALDGSLHEGREAGLVVVAPPDSYDLRERLEQATDVELHEGRTAFELLDGALGWISWPELGALAADLVEETRSDNELNETVHRLITDIQARFPAEEI
ncbi:MAG: hypothetical protein ACLGI2_05090 [Acidimicrobiia bacterium]